MQVQDSPIKLRLKDQSLLSQSLLIGLGATLIQLAPLGISRNDISVVALLFSIYTWIPVVLGYFVSYLFCKRKNQLSTTQRLATYIIACLFTIIGIFALMDEESAMYTFLFYLFIFAPIQLVLVLMIDFVKRMRCKEHGNNISSKLESMNNVTIVIYTILVTYIFVSIGETYRGIILYSGMFAWLPILLSYLFSYISKVKQPETVSRCIIFLIADLLTVAFFTLTRNIGSEIPLRLIQAYPLQLFIILVIDFIRMLFARVKS